MGLDVNHTQKRILIVEDEQAIADNIAFAVETEHMEAVYAPTAGEAEQRLAEGAVDLIVLDVGLPDESGFDFCRRIRGRSDVPIIFLTARESEIDRIVGLELGADDYMSKPFSPRELTARIRAILRRSGNAVPGDGRGKPEPLFSVDQKTKTIFYRGAALNLSRYEFRMLELMIRHPGQVFSRDQLMNHAWEEPDASYDRTVDTHIKTLRSKLRNVDPVCDCLQTRRGFGYCLRVDV
ncbi:two-component system response regulator CreB [Pontiella agarivorans]|uniref:Two-component system response regulator CreB n=1 Tax=Pontiella agarivorans TaxID=3038953 RepID=A0ABU5MV78_9BACT|nr:two-component system response regulator CreB [Pontiella agarivorans]MDZ8118107.1 two-component system response regulator CreB [Pontiella agarivorans]